MSTLRVSCVSQSLSLVSVSCLCLLHCHRRLCLLHCHRDPASSFSLIYTLIYTLPFTLSQTALVFMPVCKRTHTHAHAHARALSLSLSVSLSHTQMQTQNRCSESQQSSANLSKTCRRERRKKGVVGGHLSNRSTISPTHPCSSTILLEVASKKKNPNRGALEISRW